MYGLINSLMCRGGLKLKLVIFVLFSILTTVGVLNYFTIPLIKSYMKDKAFEVSITTVERIAEFSSFALLERTYENRLNLDDSIEKVEKSDTKGIIGISIYQRQKNDNNVSFTYLSGFGLNNKEMPLDENLLNTLNNSMEEEVIYHDYSIRTPSQTIDTYRFSKPIIYTYQNHSILLGVALLYYDKTSINGVIEELLEVILWITISILLVITLFVYFIGANLTKPLLQITQAAAEIAKGNFDINLSIKTNDEIEYLAKQFNKMILSLREHEKMQKFVSNSTMHMLQEDASSKLTLAGEHRTLTFLFCDIRNFTTMSEEKEPLEVIGIVNFYLNLQSKIIKANGGDIDKFIGDEVMASFSGPDATKKALKSAIEIQALIKRENIKREKSGETVCEVGIGIHRGEVIAGNIGSDDRMNFTSIGSVVNIASRLCSNAAPAEILIEKNTYEQADAKYIVELKPSFSAKGLKNNIEVYSIMHTER
ncbi:MAG: HAMP domain-containing protein [Epsilonproteobacteria bacterium]|nr:HAMP domain-containing protein [Campylobacterota bacterium]NCO26672.1 HAMP domain-containing protein [Campylobacterota bacterium]NCO29973.1 HAMP domain-containing protein [Campylobacterota bacterium]NCS70049.1 HAMP domain-containing protein [Campylobacterota bacterium]OIO14784.1 MAG: hypothetical protein AUJ81_08695 [Helicobacteraceae bacterium CG1_02_36_14]